MSKKMISLIQRGWCKGTFARSASGRPVHPDSTSAKKFCIAGAMHKVGMTNAERLKFQAKLICVVGSVHVHSFNDSSTKGQVLAALRKMRDA